MQVDDGGAARPARTGPSRSPRLLAVASGGGHWVQLLRMRPAFEGWDVHFVSTFPDQAGELGDVPLYIVPDTSRFRKSKILVVAWLALKTVLKVRPRAIITTGSAPGLFFLMAGRLVGARTLWVDSIANSQRLSSSGRAARRVAHRTVSQWPEVAAAEGVEYWGTVL